MTTSTKTTKLRSQVQNKALHLGCTQISNTLLEHGKSMNDIIQRLDVPPTMEAIKVIYKSIAKSMFGVDSTTKLESGQVDKVWEVLAKAVSEETGVHIGFPSEETRQEALESYQQFINS